jgi:hypothetical protein
MTVLEEVRLQGDIPLLAPSLDQQDLKSCGIDLLYGQRVEGDLLATENWNDDKHL